MKIITKGLTEQYFPFSKLDSRFLSEISWSNHQTLDFAKAWLNADLSALLNYKFPV